MKMPTTEPLPLLPRLLVRLSQQTLRKLRASARSKTSLHPKKEEARAQDKRIAQVVIEKKMMMMMVVVVMKCLRRVVSSSKKRPLFENPAYPSLNSIFHQTFEFTQLSYRATPTNPVWFNWPFLFFGMNFATP